MSEGLEGLLAGRTLVGRYRIEEVIGRGGFAVVYRAEDLRLGRPAAVKVITLRAGDAEARERLRRRFQEEARAAASLPHHPNLVGIHDFGTDEETGIDFIAMELLRGETLAQYLAREPRPALGTALSILRDAAEGLAVGHRAGLVHRDVKPGNIFLAQPLETGEEFRVCILDFGIARLVDAEDGTLTRHEALPLSPAYASPEQLRGDRRLTPASDVFSLGLVGYQLLTGERVYTADRAATDAGDSSRLAATVPAPIAAVIARALAPEPEARFADAGAFAGGLDASAGTSASVPGAPVDQDPTVVYPAATSATRAAPPARRRGARWLLALPVLAVAGGVWALAGSGGVGGPADPVPGATELRADSDSAPVEEVVEDDVPDRPAVEPSEPVTASVPVAGADPAAPPPAVAGEPSPPVQVPAPSRPGRPAPAQPTPPAPTQPTPPTQPQPTPPAPPQPQPTEPAPPPSQPQPPQPQPPPQQPAPLPVPAPPRDTLRIPPLPGDGAETAGAQRR